MDESPALFNNKMSSNVETANAEQKRILTTHESANTLIFPHGKMTLREIGFEDWLASIKGNRFLIEFLLLEFS